VIPAYEREVELAHRGQFFCAEFTLDEPTRFFRSETNVMGQLITRPEEITRAAYVAAQVAWAADRYEEAGWTAEEVEVWLQGVEDNAQEQLAYERETDDRDFYDQVRRGG
jgi:hypothetical protein